ncbi:aldo/keto reductase [Proteinivorax hydrogeniformans]|uniref:Aldo/keto reductase n=1 Tax=Proteinivorax hydrogeniformans TaxID=1826727 RepID=A0AAU8HW27_9FIRM
MNKFGSTDLNINPLGFGGIPIQRISPKQTVEVIAKAKDLGVNFIDSAQGYTDSEEKIGQAIKNHKDYWVLASKAPAKDEKSMEEAIYQSLKNFGRDYIDLYQMHLVSSEDDLKERLNPESGAIKALLKAQKNGYIGHIGITGHRPEILAKAIDIYPFVSVQAPYNFLETQSEDLLVKAANKGVATIIMKPMAGGALASPTASIKYILQKDFVTVAIPGMESVEQVVENVTAANNLEMTNEEKDGMEKDIHELQHNFCRRCEYCQPCPQGIKIHSCFIFHGYHKRYGLKDWALPRYKTLPTPASACTECGLCETKCPYELPIREMLKEVACDFEN